MTNSEVLEIRKIEFRDSPEVANLIKTVMPEFGASGPGFAINDEEVDSMYEAYQKDGHTYFVVTNGEQILGGGGIAPLENGPSRTCELRKMYFRKEIRSRGLGRKLLVQCLTAAKNLGYERCYLETLETMTAARRLYERSGFTRLPGPIGKTGHFSCDAFYLKIFDPAEILGAIPD